MDLSHLTESELKEALLLVEKQQGFAVQAECNNRFKIHQSDVARVYLRSPSSDLC